MAHFGKGEKEQVMIIIQLLDEGMVRIHGGLLSKICCIITKTKKGAKGNWSKKR